METLEMLPENFHAKYEKMYTYSMKWRDAEFLTFRLKVTAARQPLEMASTKRAKADVETAPRGSRSCLFDGDPAPVDTPAYNWDRMEPGLKVAGPVPVDDKTTKVLVLPGFTCEIDAYHNLVLVAQKCNERRRYERSSIEDSIEEAPWLKH